MPDKTTTPVRPNGEQPETPPPPSVPSISSKPTTEALDLDTINTSLRVRLLQACNDHLASLIAGLNEGIIEPREADEALLDLAALLKTIKESTQ